MASESCELFQGVKSVANKLLWSVMKITQTWCNSLEFKIIFSAYYTRSRVCLCFFCFISCKTSNNLNEVNSKFQNNRHCGCEAVEALCFVLSHITWWNNFAAVQINEPVGKIIWKASKARKWKTTISNNFTKRGQNRFKIGTRNK